MSKTFERDPALAITIKLAEAADIQSILSDRTTDEALEAVRTFF